MHDVINTLINGPTLYTQTHHLTNGWTLVVVLGALLLEFTVIVLVARLLFAFVINLPSIISGILRRFGAGKYLPVYALLQLTFPTNTAKSAYATEQLHIVLRNLYSLSTLWERLVARKRPYSLELVATMDEGIRYIIRVPKDDSEVIHQTLLSFLPGLKMQEVDDYVTDTDTNPNANTNVIELKLSNDFVLPLGVNKAINEHDPSAYLTGYMRNLLEDQVVAYQIVVTPVLNHTHRRLLRRVNRFMVRIMHGKPIMSETVSDKDRIGRVVAYSVLLPIYLLAHFFTFLGGFISAVMTSDYHQKKSAENALPKPIDPYELQISTSVKEKLDQHLFEVSIRLYTSSPSGGGMSSRMDSLVSSFGTFAGLMQNITTRRGFLAPKLQKTVSRFRERSLSPHIVSWPTIISSSELSDLYHFPNTTLTKTEGFVKSRSRDLPTPLSTKHSHAKLDVVVGFNEFGGHEQEIGMSLPQRQKHVYVIGKTGTGKTTLLINAIRQDMENGKGVAVLDPHGDMFRELLRVVPEHRRKDVVVFDPSDREFPVGLNILEPGIEFANEDDKQEWITSAVLSVFEKLSEEGQWGPRMEHILRNTTLTALQTPKPSLYTMQRLLTDKTYQKEVSKNLKDPILKQFWDKEFNLMGSMQLAAATAPLTHRLGHFITSKMSRHILLQGETTVRMTDIMNEGKILLVNLAKGDVGEDQSAFFGTLLMSFMWMAAYQRTKIPEKLRRDFFVYVDEFQNFATPQFGDIMSEGRKFHISLTISHQNIAQIADKDLVKIVAGNAGTIICLKASPQDENFILPHMEPEVEKGDIVNLAPYHFYMKVTGDEAEDAFSGQTIRPDDDGSEENAQKVVVVSRKQFAKHKAEVIKEIELLMGGPVAPVVRTAPVAAQKRKIEPRKRLKNV